MAPLVAPLVAEFFGTFILVLTIGCNILTASGTFAVVSIASVLMVMIYALGGVSGAHFNPAVTITLCMAGKETDFAKAGKYIITQLAAGASAGVAASVLFGKATTLNVITSQTYMPIGLAEFFYTFSLCFCVLNTAAAKRHAGQNQYYGLAIAFNIVAGGFAVGRISGGCFNPAVALGVGAANIETTRILFYCAAQLIAATVAATLFRLVRPEDYDDEVLAKLKIGEAPPAQSRLLSEVIGTFMLVLTVGLNVNGKSPAGAYSIGAALMVMIFALGSVSGAHFNPAVTTAIVLSGREKCSISDGLTYAMAQVAGGVLGAFTYMAMDNKSFALQPGQGYVLQQAIVAEFIFTVVLAFVVLSVATTKNPLDNYFGLAIGGCVVAGGTAIGAVSGGSLNPAVTIGANLSNFFASKLPGDLSNILVYSGVELCAGALAAGIFSVTHPGEYAVGEKQPLHEA